MTAVSDLAPVRIRTEGPYGPSWVATCRLCSHALSCEMWEDAMEFSLGHLMFTHEGWWKRFCEHDYAAHGGPGKLVPGLRCRGSGAVNLTLHGTSDSLC